MNTIMAPKIIISGYPARIANAMFHSLKITIHNVFVMVNMSKKVIIASKKRVQLNENTAKTELTAIFRCFSAIKTFIIVACLKELALLLLLLDS